MSDLQCAATLLIVPHGAAVGLERELAHRKVAQVWTSTAEETEQVAKTVAAALGVGVTALADLGDPERLDAALAEIADQTRGETVLVVLASGDGVVEVVIDGEGRVDRPWPRRTPLF